MIDYGKVTIRELDKHHFELDFWLYIYFNYRLIYKGGEEFLRAAGQQTTTRASAATAQTSPIIDLMSGRNRRRRFLYQLEGEPDTAYIARWERCYYINYLAAIQDYFRHWLFSQPPVMRPVDGEDAPDWFAPFMDNCNGSGDTFSEFSKDVFGDVLTVRKAGWLIGRPKDVAALWQGDDRDGDAPVVLTPYSAEDILDWEIDDTGELNWILLKKERMIREFPDDRKRVEIRTYIDRDSWGAWQVSRDPSDPKSNDTAQLLAQGSHSLGQVPFVLLELPFGLWPSNKLASWQVSLFNQMSMLDHSQLNSAFLQPYVKSHDPGAKERIFGSGYLVELQAGGNGRDAEEFGWATPDIAPLEFSAKRLIEQRDEGYRIVHQMSLAVDSQAIGAIARSGASKIEDRRATEVILNAYGRYQCRAETKTLNLISQIVGDNTEWVVQGYDNFQVSSLEEELQTAALVSTFGFWSKTAESELHKQIETGRVLGHVDERTKETIRQEINDKREQDEEQAMAPQVMPDGTLLGPPKAPTVQPGALGVPPKPPLAMPPVPPGPKSNGKVAA